MYKVYTTCSPKVRRNSFFFDFPSILDDVFETRTTQHVNVDVIENEKDYVLHADLPGVSKKDVKVFIDEDNYLVLKVEKEKEESEEEVNYVRKERSEFKFERKFYLKNIESDQISAKLKDGVLSVVIPKVDESKLKQFVEIK